MSPALSTAASSRSTMSRSAATSLAGRRGVRGPGSASGPSGREVEWEVAWRLALHAGLCPQRGYRPESYCALVQKVVHVCVENLVAQEHGKQGPEGEKRSERDSGFAP